MDTLCMDASAASVLGVAAAAVPLCSSAVVAAEGAGEANAGALTAPAPTSAPTPAGPPLAACLDGVMRPGTNDVGCENVMGPSSAAESSASSWGDVTRPPPADVVPAATARDTARPR